MAAHETLPYSETMAATADALLRSVSGTDHSAEKGVVRVTCSEVIGVEVLPPVLASFRQKHAGIEIELVPTDRNEDLIRRDANVAVQMVRPSQAALIAKHAGNIELGLFASEAYLATHTSLRQPSDFRQNHILIGDDRRELIIAALNAVGLSLARRDFAYRTDSSLAQLAAIRAGVGIGACQVPLAVASTPPLRRIFPSLRFDLEAWVVMHEDMKPVRRIRLVFEHLFAGLKTYAENWIEDIVSAPPPSPRTPADDSGTLDKAAE